VKDNNNSPAAETVCDDNTFARPNVTLLDGKNTFTAVGEGGSGRWDAHTTTVNLPALPKCCRRSIFLALTLLALVSCHRERTAYAPGFSPGNVRRG
jgi:hypothetical protein